MEARSSVLLSSTVCFFFFSSRRRHTRFDCDWSSDVCSSDLNWLGLANVYAREGRNQEALEDLNRAIALAPDRADLRAARGRALRDLGSRDERSEERRVGKEGRSRWSPYH